MVFMYIKSTWSKTILLFLVSTCFYYYYMGLGYIFLKYPSSQSNALEVREIIIRERIDEAELIWRRGVSIRHKTQIDRPYAVQNPWDGNSLTIIWDFYYPTFNCPHLIERMGRVGDGGKWVCGISHLKKRAKSCVVYSYGVKDDTSFEEDILSRAHCILRAFDHTVNPEDMNLTRKYIRSTFDKIKLGISDIGNQRTLKTEMKLHGDEFIDILKVDVEGGEFQLLPQIQQDFPNGFPFGQLLIEVHLNSLSKEKLFKQFQYWWESLENAGLRPFHNEANLHALYYAGKNPAHFEFSFLNIRIDHILLHA